jgi:hypothetical protein
MAWKGGLKNQCSQARPNNTVIAAIRMQNSMLMFSFFFMSLIFDVIFEYIL